MSFWKKLFRIEEAKPGPKPENPPSPTEPPVPMNFSAVLDPRSQTWMHVRTWAEDRLQKAREKNDSANRDLIQTSLLRGEIKILKELINLPNPKTVRGLLEEDRESSED